MGLLEGYSISVNRVLYKRRGVCELKEPKTNRSRRRVKMTPKLASYLASYKAEQEAFYCEHMGKPLALDCLVLTTPDGKPIDPSVLSHTFKKLAKRAGLEGVRFHDLRHSVPALC